MTLTDLDPLREELFPAEQARIVQLLVERITISLRTDALTSLMQDMRFPIATDTEVAV